MSIEINWIAVEGWFRNARPVKCIHNECCAVFIFPHCLFSRRYFRFFLVHLSFIRICGSMHAQLYSNYNVRNWCQHFWQTICRVIELNVSLCWMANWINQRFPLGAWNEMMIVASLSMFIMEMAVHKIRKQFGRAHAFEKVSDERICVHAT